jgi:hypothetical protein
MSLDKLQLKNRKSLVEKEGCWRGMEAYEVVVGGGGGCGCGCGCGSLEEGFRFPCHEVAFL